MPDLDPAAKRPDWVPEHLFPFRSRFLEMDGHRIHYVDEGEGTPLLMLHGNPTWSFLYRVLIAGLRGRFRCVALDYPGFGLSRASVGYDFRPANHALVVQRFLEVLDLRTCLLMVHDWGGPIGLWVAGGDPGRFAGVVIGNTWGWPVAGDAHFERFSKVMGGTVGGFAIRHFNAFVNVLIPLGMKRRRPTRACMAAYRGPFPDPESREATHVFPREILGSEAFLEEVERRLPRLADLPALILWGDADPAFRATERERFERAFPRHETVVLRGAGHYIQEDAPDEIVPALTAWWEREEPTPDSSP